jgi:hypothetical protein
MTPSSESYHPLWPIIQGFLYIDEHNQHDLVGCIEATPKFEDGLKDSRKHSPVIGLSLSTLNKSLSELRTRLQYMDTSIDTMLRAFDYGIMPLADTRIFNASKIAYGPLWSVKGSGSSKGVEDDEVQNYLRKLDEVSTREDSVRRAKDLKETCKQRLLDIEAIQQRLNIFLFVVRLLRPTPFH